MTLGSFELIFPQACMQLQRRYWPTNLSSGPLNRHFGLDCKALNLQLYKPHTIPLPNCTFKLNVLSLADTALSELILYVSTPQSPRGHGIFSS